MQTKFVLITGASSGIGLALAERFAQTKYNLILVARNAEKLKEIEIHLSKKYTIHVVSISQDLGEPKAFEKIFSIVQEKNITVDILVNNAGLGNYGNFSETDLKTEQEMMQVNMVALTELTKVFLPGMQERNYGKILNVASTAGFQPGPFMAVYFASKAYVLSFSEALDEELKNSNIQVSVLCPGPTSTNFQKRAFHRDEFFFGTTMDVDTVADICFKQFLEGKRIIIPGLKNTLLAWSTRLLPRSMVTQVMAKMMKRKD